MKISYIEHQVILILKNNWLEFHVVQKNNYFKIYDPKQDAYAEKLFAHKSDAVLQCLKFMGYQNLTKKNAA